MPGNFLVPHKSRNARDPASKASVLQGAIEGHVLVKNVNKTLPLKKPDLISVFGYDAPAPPEANIAAQNGNYRLGFLSNYGLAWLATIRYPFQQPGKFAPNGTLITGGGSGGASPAYISAPLDALQQRAYEDDTVLYYDTVSNNPAIHAESDACIVFINAYATEGVDREALYDNYSDALVKNVANKCSNTIVVIHNAGIRLVDQWIEHPNVTALIFAHLPGQDSGRAVVSLLYGDESPSGKLPYTVAKNESDYNVPVAHPEGEFFRFPQDDFTEGVYIGTYLMSHNTIVLYSSLWGKANEEILDYKDFDQKKVQPRYEFGFGLTYTTFEYSGLRIALKQGANTSYAPPTSRVSEGGLESLWDVIATVKATVTNTGDVKAKEVAQLYVHIPGGPVKQLRGFSKVEISPGESAEITFSLTRKDLSDWNTNDQRWNLQQATYNVMVGASSRILPLTGDLVIG